MFWSYVKTIFRNITRSKIYFFINIAGLAIGFTVFSLIMLFVLNEFNYDTFNKKADRIYRVVEIREPPGGQPQQVAITMPALAPALKEAFPEVVDAARYFPWPTVLCTYDERRFYENGLSFADPSILNIFTFDFIEGNPSTALDGPYNVVIDQTTARKYFGDSDPIGKFIHVDAGLEQSAFQVTGVIRDFPLNSHLRFNMIASFSALERHADVFNGWGNNSVVTYVLLKKDQPPGRVEKGLPELIRANLPKNGWSAMEMYLQPLSRIHLHSDQILFQVNYSKGDINHVRLFILIALFVIVLACINFINLTTARSAVRTREVGIRKLLGTYHSHLVYQFMAESIVFSMIGMLLSFPVVEAVLPTFNSMMGQKIVNSYNNQFAFFLAMVLVAAVVGIVAGVYPALYLSSFKPVQLLKGRFSSSKTGIFLRKALTVLQFSIAISLVTATTVVIDQMQYIYSKPLGFNEKNLMYVPLRDTKSRNSVHLLSERLLSEHDILAVSAGELTGSGATQGQVFIPGAGERSNLMVRESYVDYGYIKAMGMRLIDGRDFSRNFPADSSSIIINETMARMLGWKNPIGKQIQMQNGELYSVMGVVKDFNYFSLRNKVDPLLIWLGPGRCRYLIIRIASQDQSSTISFVRKTWNSLLPTHPFEYGFLDNYLQKQYASERRNEHLLGLFSLVAILIASLGLFGLTLHSTQERIKEIGVRKVLGASVPKIVLMLSQESIRLVAIACVIAWPTAYYLMSRWLDDFAYHIDLSVWTFVLSGLFVFLTALLTLSFQAIKAGFSNPVDALRYE